MTAAAGSVTKTASLAVSLPGLGMTLSPAYASLVRGSTLQIKLTTSAEGGFNSALSLAVSGLPSGVTAAFLSTKIGAPGSGSSTLTLTASKTATLGAAKLQVTVTGTGFSGVAAMPFTVVAASSSSHPHPL